jgi:outer membrane protein insertion porin family
MRKLFLSACLLTAGAVSLPVFASAQATQQQAPAQQPPAQQPPGGGVSVCGVPIAAPVNLPPVGSGPVVYQLALCFPKQDGKSVIEGSTYRYYIQTTVSRPSANVWVPYDDGVNKTLLEDFKRLWGTNFLDDLSIDAIDYTFSNGVVGKIIVYNMEERQRVKIVDYEGNKHVESSKIDEKLKEDNATIRLDSFIDQAAVQKVRSVIKTMLAEKGYEFASVTPAVVPIQGGTKTVHLTFQVDEGPKVRIKQVTFVGNKAVSSGKLRKQMKSNKQEWLFSFVTSRGTFQRDKYEEDADRVVGYYRDLGYIAARIGEPELKYIQDSADKATRWVQLRIPVNEGERYRVSAFTFDGAKVIKPEFLRTLFKLKSGDWYSDKVVRKGLDKAREVYGTVGYWEFTGFPDLTPEGQENPEAPSTDAQTPQPAAKPPAPRTGPPKVAVAMRLTEGKQYFVNRITLQGNTTTRDNVVRREMRLVEGGVFNTEALKYSVKRINQLGYFKNIEGDPKKDMFIDKTPGADNKVDVTLKVEEQNRNQITFGAGVSQYEGFFGQVGFQTANFMGKGETFNVSLQAGSRAQMYQVGFTEPFLFDRNMTGGVNVYRRRLEYIYQFTENSTGGDITFGVPVGPFARMFFNYGLQKTRVSDVNPLYLTPAVLASNPYLAETLLIGQSGARVISKITPSYVYNTIDNPIFPNSGRRFTASIDLAGLGGDTNYYKPSAEAVIYKPIGQTGNAPPRTTLGFRAQAQYLSPFTGSYQLLPIYERLVLGGEYSVRGFDIRTIGPKATNSLLVIGGNKSLLFNAEYQITIAGPVRLIMFADAGQVQDFGTPFRLKDPITRVVDPAAPLLSDPLALVTLRDPNAPNTAYTETLGYTSAFKTSVGAEVRFFMPVLNVPFRLIMAYNPSRAGVLDNNYQLAKSFTFRFAVGSTF